eukprot:3329770-Rhodomonas_salina.2
MSHVAGSRCTHPTLIAAATLDPRGCGLSLSTTVKISVSAKTPSQPQMGPHSAAATWLRSNSKADELQRASVEGKNCRREAE